jgi:hypothetical protein
MGLVLVFDLDQTIIDSSDPYLFNRPNTVDGIRELKFRAKSLLNFRLVNDVIKRAARLRRLKDASGNDILSGIFLLTNNSSKIMVSAIDSVIREEIAAKNPEVSVGKYMSENNIDPDTQGMPRQDYFFDSILMREHRMRTPGVPEVDEHNPVKNLDDVKRMLAFIGVKLSDEDLRHNTFFFDDMEHPGMRLLGGGYIKITPPFRRDMRDDTNYEPVLRRLSELDGQPIVPPKLTRAERLAQSQGSAKPPLTVVRSVPAPLPVQRTVGRNRSNTMNEGAGNNMGLPPPPQEVTVRRAPTLRGTLSSLFSRTPSGGSRFRRTRRNRRNKSRKRLRK